MIEILSTLLRDGANPALRYQNDSSLLSDLAKTIAQYFENETDFNANLPQLKILIMQYDYRLVAEYLVARKKHDEKVLSLFYRLLSEKDPVIINKYRYELAYARFADTNHFGEQAIISFTYKLDDIFSSHNQQLIIYLQDEQFRAPLLNLIDAVGNMLGKFIEQQYDMPGLNAVVRQGLVRSWHLPDGTAVVSKRENHQKKGRFQKEQNNHINILNRLGKQAIILLGSANDDNIIIQIARPFAVIHDGYSGQHYALSVFREGISLEDVLLTEQDSIKRNCILMHYRLLLDTLYENGILWGDMSPRNILMKRQGREVTYTLVDFEKTIILDSPISHLQRIEHCRGQICVEELAVLCPIDEVLASFNGYFDPTEWDIESESPLNFSPRPEITDVLQGRGYQGDVTLGVYNKLDRDIMGVRIPDIDPLTKIRRFPGHLGFKVEHYLSCSGNINASDYDRKTTEILIAAKQQDCFDNLVAILKYATATIESAFLKEEFLELLRDNFSGNLTPPLKEIEKLVQILDAFYQIRHQNDAYLSLVAQWQNSYG